MMARIVLLMDGLPDHYAIPPKILKLCAFEIVVYFMVTPIMDLLSSAATHEMIEFYDETTGFQFVCGEVVQLWMALGMAFGDLMLCSTMIGIYLFAVGEMIIEPVKNQKLIDICIRYAIFSIFAGVFIMIGNGFWSTVNLSIGRYIDNIFVILTIMYLLTLCSSCYLQCCAVCHSRMRTKYINQFLKTKENWVRKVWYIRCSENVPGTD